ncbi:MAG TPA: hypothetical protein VHT53_03030 [Candidatus Elarobacter sp.]|jgi:hypothetical protein|nr:hypothetical protein [Candidatus Elarobacter sp.]
MTVGFVPPSIPTPPRRGRFRCAWTRRSLAALLAVALTGGAFEAGVAAPRASAPPVLLVTDVGDGAQGTMPAALWRKLAIEALHARTTAAESGTALPDAAQCRGAGAEYAVLATFDRALRLPGLAQDPGRAYAIARITVRDCATGEVATKAIRIESDPIAPLERGDPEASAPRVWDRAVRAAFARDPIVFGARATSSPAPRP